MEQLEQLRAMRDAASTRVEEAKAAIDNGPDAKLAASLTTLIADLEQQFGFAPASAPAEESNAPVFEADFAQTIVEDQEEETTSEPAYSAPDIPDFAAETEVTGAAVTLDMAEAGADDSVESALEEALEGLSLDRAISDQQGAGTSGL
ncbi:MAG: hypothetical protein H6888_10805 [Nitratireductor sp.]|nr:hypothetical protein [Nitratireductor sp.]MCC0021545.1 hypothetical protein [Nitratireductor sp.]